MQEVWWGEAASAKPMGGKNNLNTGVDVLWDLDGRRDRAGTQLRLPHNRHCHPPPLCTLVHSA